MTKIMTILGTRPEIIKLSKVINEVDKYFDHTLVHTGQNYDYELNEIFFNDLEVRKPDYFLDVASERTGETIGNIISKSDEVFVKENPIYKLYNRKGSKDILTLIKREDLNPIIIPRKL